MATANNNKMIPFELGMFKIQIPKKHYRWTIIVIAIVIIAIMFVFGFMAYKNPIGTASI